MFKIQEKTTTILAQLFDDLGRKKASLFINIVIFKKKISNIKHRIKANIKVC